MPLTGIVTIVFRIYSLIWLVDGIIRLLTVVSTSQSSHTIHVLFLEPAIFILGALVVFTLSQPIAGIVTPPPNAEVNVGRLSNYDLYCFAFTFLGLNFVLSSVASMINAIHYYFVVVHSTHDGDQKQADSFYRMTRPLLTMAAGFISLLFAPRFARKLAAVQRKYDETVPAREASDSNRV
jgi:hypothetical protein